MKFICLAMLFILSILGIYLALFITSPLIAVFHELGHALAYLVLTKPDRIDVFIGSYGDEKSYHINVGKFRFYVKYTFPFVRGIGLCKSYTRECNPYKNIIILLAGPFFSLMAALIIGYFVFYFNMNGPLRLFCAALIGCSAISLLTNLIPFHTSPVTDDMGESDGKQLMFNIKYRKVYNEYLIASDHYSQGSYELAAEKFNNIIQHHKPHERLLRLQTACLIQLKNYPLALESIKQLNTLTHLRNIDYLNRGYIYSRTNEHELAVKDYQVILKTDRNNLMALNNLGHELTESGDYKKAERLLKQAIKLNPDFSNPISILGHLNTLTGNLQVAKILLDKSQEVEPNEPYNYKHFGIYYLKLQNAEMALISFNKCLELDSTINLKDYLSEVKSLQTA